MRKFTPVEFVLDVTSPLSDLYNKPVETVFAPGYICLDDVLTFRRSVDITGNLENYTYVELTDGLEVCVNIPLYKFHAMVTGEEPKELTL